MASAVLTSNMVGIGDLLYHTPTIRYLSKIFGGNLDVWTYVPEVFMRNPYIRKLYKMHSPNLPSPWMFYGARHFFVGREGDDPLQHSACHTIDYVSASCFRTILEDKDKKLDFFIRPEVLTGVTSFLMDDSPYVVLHPCIGWKSRTLPESFYAEVTDHLRDLGYNVVLLGRTMTPQFKGADNVNETEHKGIYTGDWTKDCINLMDKTTLEESAAILKRAAFSILGETGLNPLAAAVNARYVYIPQLMPPEFRICSENVVVVKRDEPYVSQNIWQELTFTEMEPWIPKMENVYEAIRGAIQLYLTRSY